MAETLANIDVIAATATPSGCGRRSRWRVVSNLPTGHLRKLAEKGRGL